MSMMLDPAAPRVVRGMDPLVNRPAEQVVGDGTRARHFLVDREYDCAHEGFPLVTEAGEVCVRVDRVLLDGEEMDRYDLRACPMTNDERSRGVSHPVDEEMWRMEEGLDGTPILRRGVISNSGRWQGPQKDKNGRVMSQPRLTVVGEWAPRGEGPEATETAGDAGGGDPDYAHTLRCQGQTRDGRPCGNGVVRGTTYCRAHQA